MHFRERGIYRLPNGRTLVANGNALVADAETEVVSYEVTETGRLIHDGRLTAWDISDVSDTGTTADED